MTIERIQISNLRIIEHLELEPAAGINLICGPNGSGKTSLLEAIYILGKGRSFRTTRIQPVIRQGADCLDVVAWRKGESKLVAGIRRCNNRSEIRINGVAVDKLSELVRQFPVQLLTPRSHELIEHGPDLRRRFLDWALFHVEPSYQNRITNYQRALKQRNKALRSTPSLSQVWDKQLSVMAEALTQMREKYVQNLQIETDKILQRLGVELDVELSLYPGWPSDKVMSTVLRERINLDIKQGFTGLGPHRADMQIRIDRQPAVERLSRGQQKLLVLALVIAEREIIFSTSGHRALLMVDDMAAELDANARKRAVQLLEDIQCQVFVTALEPGQLEHIAAERVFHVEHGRQLS